MARGRSSSYDDQRDLILHHAAQLFAERGYSSTSMNEVAQACGLSKPTLYHYYRDKYDLLVHIADGHVSRLHALVQETDALELPAQQHLEEAIRRFVSEYTQARHAHRVLTQDVKFLQPEDRARILDKERAVVASFSRAIVALRPDMEAAQLGKVLAMLLFGMINWMFTWLRPDGSLDSEQLAPLVSGLFLGGVISVANPCPERTIDVDNCRSNNNQMTKETVRNPRTPSAQPKAPRKVAANKKMTK